MILREFLIKLGLTVEESSFAKGVLAANGIGAAVHEIGHMVKEGAEKFKELILETAEYGKETIETAKSTGLSTKALQELRDVAGEVGISSQELDTDLFRLSRSAMAAAKGTGMQSDAFHKLGVKTKDASGKMRSTEDILMDAAEGFEKMPDGIEKTSLAMEAFGRRGARLIPVFKNLAEKRKEQQVMTDEELEAGKELKESLYALHLATRNFWRQIVGPLMPAINDVVKGFVDWYKTNRALLGQKIRQYMNVLISVVKVLGTAFLESLRIGTLFRGWIVDLIGWIWKAAGAIPYLKMGIVVFGTALAVAFLPLTAAVAGLTLFLAILDDIRRYKEGKDSLFGRWANTIAEWQKPNANDPWWLRAIKELVEYLEKALGIADKMGIGPNSKKKTASGAERAKAAGLVESKTGTAPFVAANDNDNPLLSKFPDQEGMNVFQQMSSNYKRVRSRGGSRWQALWSNSEDFRTPEETAQAAHPEWRQEGGAPGGTMFIAPLNMTVNQQPGESGEDFSQRVAKLINDHHESVMEETHAQVQGAH